MKSLVVSKKHFGKTAILALAVVVTSSGCASMKSPSSWLARDKAAGSSAATEASGMASTLSNTGKGIAGQFKSMGTAVSSAVGKAKTAVTNTFSTNSNSADPLSLANMPDNVVPEVFVTQGQLFESQGNFGKALDNYTKALEAEPTNEAALLSTARLYERQSQLEPASEFFAKALSVNPLPSTYNELSLVQRKQGQLAEAQDSIKNAITLDPENLKYRNNLAGLLVSVGRSDEAVQQLEQVFEPSVAHYNVAFLHYSNKNTAAAQQHLQLALQADPSLEQARVLLAEVGGSPAAQTAVAAYQNAGELYRTAQAIATPAVTANPASYQQQAGGANIAPQAGYPLPQ